MNEPAAAPRRSLVAPLVLGAALVALAGVAIHRISSQRGESEKEKGKTLPDPRGKVLADFAEIRDFSLVDSRSQPFTRKDLDGKIWIADFFFTTCAGPCPALTTKMRSVADLLRAIPDVSFMSISVDPATDTPSVLTNYARTFGGDFERWHWLTGKEEQVKQLCANVMATYVPRNEPGGLNHSTYLYVIDRHGHVRGIHDTQIEGEWQAAVMHTVKLLLEQQPADAQPSKDGSSK